MTILGSLLGLPRDLQCLGLGVDNGAAGLGMNLRASHDHTVLHGKNSGRCRLAHRKGELQSRLAGFLRAVRSELLQGLGRRQCLLLKHLGGLGGPASQTFGTELSVAPGKSGAGRLGLTQHCCFCCCCPIHSLLHLVLCHLSSSLCGCCDRHLQPLSRCECLRADVQHCCLGQRSCVGRTRTHSCNDLGDLHVSATTGSQSAIAVDSLGHEA
mmetsp:Transcript_97720/g.232681  ORF Transcript_97720/g.232681 Transcript_97720/m.232681 type:complete len:212 (+) Transcript_97720:840-1475(+)